MSPVDALLWILAGIAGLVGLVALVTVVIVIYAVTVGLSKMRKVDDEETAIFTGRGEQ